MLRGKSINLRTVRSSDLPEYLRLASDVEARGPYFPPFMPTEVSMRNRFERDGLWSENDGTMLIVDAKTDRILGSIVYFKPVFYYDSFEIGYILYDPNDRGKGIVTEALRIFVKYLFDAKMIERLQLQIEPGNVASIRVAEKVGFTLEGIMRKAFFSRGKAVDIGVYSILREGFFEQNRVDP